MAELLGQAALASHPATASVSVVSAGTHARTDLPMHPHALEALRERGIDGRSFRTRTLTAPHVSGADLVLTATRQQRGACVQLHPAAVGRTFTLRQFARYAPVLLQSESFTRAVEPTTSAAERLRAALTSVSDLRDRLPVAGEADDLPDPVRQPVQAFRDCGAELSRTWAAIAAVIAPGRPAALR
jgi:protein-tyrosine phosphatase